MALARQHAAQFQVAQVGADQQGAAPLVQAAVDAIVAIDAMQAHAARVVQAAP
ncbi:hypothetical protein D3C86_2194410 [compost metagenome]